MVEKVPLISKKSTEINKSKSAREKMLPISSKSPTPILIKIDIQKEGASNFKNLNTTKISKPPLLHSTPFFMSDIKILTFSLTYQHFLNPHLKPDTMELFTQYQRLAISLPTPTPHSLLKITSTKAPNIQKAALYSPL